MGIFSVTMRIMIHIYFCIKVAAELSYSGFGVSASGGFSAGFAKNNAGRDSLKNTNKETKEYYIGGNPPSGGFSDGSTESLREWARSAAEKPVPIQYKLSSIDQLLTPDYFRRLTFGTFVTYNCNFRIIILQITVHIIFKKSGVQLKAA